MTIRDPHYGFIPANDHSTEGFECDYCHQIWTLDKIDPASGDLWECHECQDRWEAEDRERHGNNPGGPR